MSLAAKLPYDHAFAGGYPGIGSQPLPTDSDCLTYLAAVKAADGAGVETSVAVAVDAFFKELKATSGLFSAIKASCILCGARTITGALVPLAGTAPTSNGFVSGDYSRTAGITGDGTSFLDSNRANDADPQDSKHIAVYMTSGPSTSSFLFGVSDAGRTDIYVATSGVGSTSFRISGDDGTATRSLPASGFLAASRALSASFDSIVGGTVATQSGVSDTPAAGNSYVFARRLAGSASSKTTATIAYYSTGESLDLEALGTAVTTLITAIGEAL